MRKSSMRLLAIRCKIKIKNALYTVGLWMVFFFFMHTARSQVIHEYMDLQIHPTMHIAHSIFGPGLTYFNEEESPELTYKHQLKNVNYANYWEDNKGYRIAGPCASGFVGLTMEVNGERTCGFGIHSKGFGKILEGVGVFY